MDWKFQANKVNLLLLNFCLLDLSLICAFYHFLWQYVHIVPCKFYDIRLCYHVHQALPFLLDDSYSVQPRTPIILAKCVDDFGNAFVLGHTNGRIGFGEICGEKFGQVYNQNRSLTEYFFHWSLEKFFTEGNYQLQKCCIQQWLDFG